MSPRSSEWAQTPRLALPIADARTQHRAAVTRRRLCTKPPSTMRERSASSGCKVAKGSGRCAPEPRASARARHRVPLVAHAARVEQQRDMRAARFLQRRLFERMKARAPVWREEAALREQPLRGRAVFARGPLHRRHVAIGGVATVESADVEVRARRRFRTPTAARARRKSLRASEVENASPNPRRFATSPTIHQSGRTSPGAGGTRAGARCGARNL